MGRMPSYERLRLRDELSSDIIALLLSSKARLLLLRHVLSKSFPPIFRPHPKLNPETGRVLSRPMGGDRGMIDWYEEGEDRETWRRSAGISNVVSEVIKGFRAG